jgi:hypothetical protein
MHRIHTRSQIWINPHVYKHINVANMNTLKTGKLAKPAQLDTITKYAKLRTRR